MMEANRPEVAIRTFRPGDASYISYLHIKLYQNIYGFNGIFEYYVMKGMAEFLHHPDGGEMWVAEVNGAVAGSVSIVKFGNDTVQLRWFIVGQDYQGMNIGKKLLDTALEFCGTQKYRRVFLWTVDILPAARHLYQKYGFRLEEEKENAEWTDDVITEERWSLEL